MTTHLTKRVVFAIALLAGAAGAHAAAPGARDPFTEGGRSVQDARNPYSEGAPNVDPFDKGERFLAGWDRTGPSADPARSFDVFQDGARA